MFIVRCEDLVHHRIIFFPELKIDYDDKKQSVSEGAQLQNDIIEIREIARKNKSWDIADKLRDYLKGIGINIEDTINKPVWNFNIGI